MPAPTLTGDYKEAEIATGGSPKAPQPIDVIGEATKAPELVGNYTNVSGDIDAKKAIEMYPVSQVTGVPMDTLYENYDEVKDTMQRKKDEGLMNELGSKVRIAEYDLQKARIGWDMLTGVDDPDFERRLADLNERIQYESQFISEDNLFEKALLSVAGLYPVARESMKEGLRGGLATAMLVGGAAAITAPPTTPVATAAGFTAGTSAFAAAEITRIEAGSLMVDLYNLVDDQGNPIDQRLVKTFSLTAGAINGALEAAGVKLLLKTVPGLDKMVSAAVKNSITRLLKDGSIKSYLLSQAGRYAKFLTGETAIEVGQEITTMVMGETAKSLHEIAEGGQLEHLTLEEITDRIEETAVASVLGFGVLGAPGHSIHTMSGIIEQKSKIKNEALKKLLPDDVVTDYTQEMNNTFYRVKNLFFGKRDTRVLENKNEGRKLNEELAGLVEENQTSAELAVAMQLYRDSKNNPEAVEAALRGERILEEDGKVPVSKDFAGVKPKEKKVKKLTKPLTPTQLRLIEMSKTLTKAQKAFVDRIGKMYDEIGQEALGDEIIFNTLNNFVSRSWIRNKKTRDLISKLTQTTVHAKERRLPTIVEGWTEGLTMKTHSAVDNLIMYRDNIIRTVEQKRLINNLVRGKTDAGNPVFSTERLPGYERIKMPHYTPRKGVTHFAPRKIARQINNIFGVSAFDESQTMQNLTKFNALLKKIALSTSLFHNIAFMRSFYLGGKSMQWENLNFTTAHREGVEMIHNMDDIVKLGVYNGLTLNLIQDWEEELLIMGNDIDRITAKHTGSKRTRMMIADLWKRQVEFTFGVQGAGLKVKAFAYELRNERLKYPDENINKTAARVAALMNDDFGGLHLERLADIHPTYQHIFRLVALAPDWTRSNIRTVTGMFRRASKGGYKAQRQLYQRFWARIVLKTALATAMGNILLAGGDIDEAWDRYTAGIEKDWKNIASIDITALWGLFGMKSQDRKYFSVVGHFLDPIKFMAIPLGEPKILQYKASILMRLISDWLFNENWRGKRFKNVGEIPSGVTEFAEFLDPDTYVTYAPERKRGGILENNFSFPAFFIHSAIGSSPIAFQNLLATLSGEQDWLTGVSNTLGIRQPRGKRKRRRHR